MAKYNPDLLRFWLEKTEPRYQTFTTEYSRLLEIKKKEINFSLYRTAALSAPCRKTTSCRTGI